MQSPMTPTQGQWGVPPPSNSFTPLIFPHTRPISRNLPTTTGWHPPLADMRYTPTRSDRDPIRDRVRGLEYDDPPPTSEHMRGYPHPVPVFGLRQRLHRGNRLFLWKMGGYPHLCAMRCPPTRLDRGTP